MRLSLAGQAGTLASITVPLRTIIADGVQQAAEAVQIGCTSCKHTEKKHPSSILKLSKAAMAPDLSTIPLAVSVTRSETYKCETKKRMTLIKLFDYSVFFSNRILSIYFKFYTRTLQYLILTSSSFINM